MQGQESGQEAKGARWWLLRAVVPVSLSILAAMVLFMKLHPQGPVGLGWMLIPFFAGFGSHLRSVQQVDLFIWNNRAVFVVMMVAALVAVGLNVVPHAPRPADASRPAKG